MTKSILKCVSVLAILAFTVDIAAAQEVQKPRRKGFFESLFGSGNRDRQQQRRVARDRQWWQDGGNDVDVIYGSKKKQQKNAIADDFEADTNRNAGKTAYIDPEVSEGLGMGNRVYAPPKVIPVFDPSFAKLESVGTEASAIRLVLADKATDIRAPQDLRKLVLDYYKSTGFKPVWTSNGKVTDRAVALIAQLRAASADGLEPRRYKPAVMATFDDSALPAEGDNLGLAQLDVGLTVAAVTFARHISGGAFEPDRLSAYNDVQPEAVSAEVALRVLANTPYPDVYLRSLAPKHPAYAAMKAELDKLWAATDEPDVMAEGKRVRIGQKDDRVAELRILLVKQGYIDVADAEVDFDKSDVLDKRLAKALKAFQEANGIPQTSNLDQATVQAFNGPDNTQRREQLITNMERLRWLPKNLGDRHVFVNQASYTVDVVDGGKQVWESKVIVGRPMTQTSVFSDTMETVVFNPSWGVPQSILLNEYLPKLRSNPGYLDKIGFKTVNAQGKVVSSRSINWNSVGSGSGIGVQQPPGQSNALGELKFLFPNKHSIYMHDTPNRELFAQSKRNFSHGCVRVEDPRTFASVVLGWDRDKVDSMVESGENKTVKIDRQPQVHLTYFTAWPGKDGEIQYFSDAYGRDATLRQARATMLKAVGGPDSGKLVENSAGALAVSTE